jgi:DNA polymerase-3 subunit delta'
MSWDRIRGHAAVKQTFQTAFTRGRLGQAYLLVGPEGVGKRLFAYELAKALLCERPEGPLLACDRCPACAQVEARTHPDLHTVVTPEGKHELPIEEIRDFCSRLAHKPARGGRIIGIVEDADDFNAASANGFLKTLEEPPPGVVLLLIATSTERQLPTIRSRCQVVRFGLLAPNDLQAVLVEQGVDNPARLKQLIPLAGGRVSRALALNNDIIWQVRNELITGLTVERPQFARLAEIWEQFVTDAGKDTALQRMRCSVVIGFVVEALHRALRIAVGAPLNPTDSQEDPQVRVLAQRYGPDRLMELIETCVEADYRVERRVQLILIIESVLDQLTQPVRAG